MLQHFLRHWTNSRLAFRKNPEIDDAKNTGETALSIPIPEESGIATAPADPVPRAKVVNAPLQTTPSALPSSALSPTTTMKVATTVVRTNTMTMLTTATTTTAT
jgi:hypothetical protein